MLGWALLTIVFAIADHNINGFHAGHTGVKNLLKLHKVNEIISSSRGIGRKLGSYKIFVQSYVESELCS